jgi:hypothetical protein
LLFPIDRKLFAIVDSPRPEPSGIIKVEHPALNIGRNDEFGW